ncbi:MAG: ABC transporter permease [Actinobacteria bacterium]|nr:ABC transporter permease [Actinomycetota bacterium]
MLRNTFLRTLRDQRKSLFWWAFGMVGTSLYLALFYPVIRDNMANYEKILQSMPESVKSIFMANSQASLATADGYINIELFSMVAPILFLVFAIGVGSAAVAGEEEKGTLDLLLANPLSRWRIVVEKFGAMVVGTVGLGFLFWLTLFVGGKAVGMDANFARVAEATVSVVLLALAQGSIALAVGSAFGKRGVATGMASGLAFAFYLLNALAPMVKALKPYRKLSLWYYYIGNDPVMKGLKLSHVGVLVGVILVLLAVALVAFDRRDLSV